MTREFIDFILQHEHEDTARLLLSAARYPNIDMPLAVQQIEGRRTALAKWPSLYACHDYLYPPRLNREQSSSEATARHKASLLTPHSSLQRVADLTGGMGIDTLALARLARHVDYVESDPSLCTLMEHNLNALGITNVSVHCADSLQWLADQAIPFDILYLDPARRDSAGRKVAGLAECTPDLLPHLDLLRSHSRRLMIKTSPMIDIDLATSQLQSVSDIHVVSLDGECKEVLFLCGSARGEPQLHCDLLSGKNGLAHTISFTRTTEASTEAPYCTATATYLYEPDAALMKAGPFRLICQWYNLAKLAPNTHLYTADHLVKGFPGRILHILKEVKPSRRAVAAALPDGKVHVATRNYPLNASELQRQLGLKEGGDLFLIATTLGTRPTAFLARQIATTV